MKWKRLLVVPALGLGVLALGLLLRSRSEPGMRPPGESRTSVRTLEVPRLTVVPRALGYGAARPGRVWRAVPMVGGRVLELAASVREGSFVSENDVLVRIDSTDYEIEVRAAEASLVQLNAELQMTHAREETLRATLALERESLELANAELTRLRALAEKKTISASDLEREQRAHLVQRLKVQAIENSVTLLDPERSVLAARIAQAELRLDRARVDAKRTEIRAPFDARIGPVDVEQDQVVQAGQVLFQADSIASTEVTAWIPLASLRQLLSASHHEIDVLSAERELPAQLGLGAVARLHAAGKIIEWEAQVVRVRGIDSRTRNVGIDVAVASPYAALTPSLSPPLQRGMYVEVEIRGPSLPDQVAIPRSALHDGTVLLVGPDDRLERRAVDVAFSQSAFVVVRGGLQGGEVLVLSDLVPAVDGMLLDPQKDGQALASLQLDVSGSAAAR